MVSERDSARWRFSCFSPWFQAFTCLLVVLRYYLWLSSTSHKFPLHWYHITRHPAYFGSFILLPFSLMFRTCIVIYSWFYFCSSITWRSSPTLYQAPFYALFFCLCSSVIYYTFICYPVSGIVFVLFPMTFFFCSPFFLIYSYSLRSTRHVFAIFLPQDIFGVPSFLLFRHLDLPAATLSCWPTREGIATPAFRQKPCTSRVYTVRSSSTRRRDLNKPNSRREQKKIKTQSKREGD